KVSGSPQDIVESVPLILPKAGLARSRFDSWIKSRNVKPIVAAEAEGNEAVMALAALGLGIGLVPQIVLENGPYREGFICHSAGNALGCYDIGFIQKTQISGSESVKKIRLAATDILHNTDWNSV
ncbi:MAG: LysR family transcriptional regulator, partial [Treponema sp.]|nr:LysR family transcriptional regulator [Treponema sp.]